MCTRVPPWGGGGESASVISCVVVKVSFTQIASVQIVVSMLIRASCGSVQRFGSKRCVLAAGFLKDEAVMRLN